MCALEKSVCTEDAAVNRARDALQGLIHTPNPAASQISTAIDALEKLRARLSTAQHIRKSIRQSAAKQATRKADEDAHLNRLDSEIIQAKMEVGELLTERDLVARDLGRARRTLERLDASVEEMRKEKRERKREERNSGGSALSDEQKVQKLLKATKEDMFRMRDAEERLVKVVEQLDVVRKRKAELQEKVRMAQEEW
eukprot:GFKZ01000382.1.p1 GENE.GFKZ01000382.1~~GFKZ01000382.1.p1  ORF type:complete len:198 (+),score=50.66 GFKZ01000382.1:271-864(+)